MTLKSDDYRAIRRGIAAIPGDVSNDAVGAYTPKLEDIFAPETHSTALDPATPIVVGSRGAGKSFWAGVLGKEETRHAAATAYPNLGLEDLLVQFGFTGVPALKGVGVDELNEIVPSNATPDQAKTFWWATILRAAAHSESEASSRVADFVREAAGWKSREAYLLRHEEQLGRKRRTLLVVYDALDMVATNWPRRRLLTEALLEVVWAMRAYLTIKPKLFLRPDQIDDDALRFVELPKLRTGAVRLAWAPAELYGLLFARLALSRDDASKSSFRKLLKTLDIAEGNKLDILARRWPLAHAHREQQRVMEALAGKHMSSGPYGYKKGKTYDWPVNHLADAFEEVTPRSFLGLMIAAAKHGSSPEDRVLTPDGIRHGLRAASKTRVDQLHSEFPWIKGVLAPLDGLLLPKEKDEVFQVWRRANTIKVLIADASANNYLPPFPSDGELHEGQLFLALERIGVMFRRKDNRIDMPDLFWVAAKLLKKGGTAPL